MDTRLVGSLISVLLTANSIACGGDASHEPDLPALDAGPDNANMTQGKNNDAGLGDLHRADAGLPSGATCTVKGDDPRLTPNNQIQLLSDIPNLISADCPTCDIDFAGVMRAVGAVAAGQSYVVQCTGVRNPAATPDTRQADVIDVSEQGGQYCALTKAGTVMCWGDLGHKNGQAVGTLLTEPTLVPQLNDAVAILPPCAARKDGSIVCWGDSYTAASTAPLFGMPVSLSGAQSIVSIAQEIINGYPHGYAGYAIAADGHVFEWDATAQNRDLQDLAFPGKAVQVTAIYKPGTGDIRAMVRTAEGDVVSLDGKTKVSLPEAVTDLRCGTALTTSGRLFQLSTYGTATEIEGLPAPASSVGGPECFNANQVNMGLQWPCFVANDNTIQCPVQIGSEFKPAPPTLRLPFGVKVARVTGDGTCFLDTEGHVYCKYVRTYGDNPSWAALPKPK